jgi:selenocysteine-specific elongation factor
MKSVVVGTAGHIDHGKSALVRALTGIDPDRLKEEKARGITIDLGFAHLTIGDITFAFVDVPGHERFVKNMLAGVGGIDLVVLVVAANESVMPQTREHFEICRLLRVPAGLVAVTKVDLVDEETVDLVRMEIGELTAGSALANASVVPVSSRTGQGLDHLRDALVQAAVRIRGRSAEGGTRLPIDRVFSVKGFGTVVTGTLVSGRVRADESLRLVPGDRAVKVRSIQIHGLRSGEAVAGQRTAINLGGVEVNDIHRGQSLTEPDVCSHTRVADAVLEVLPDAKPIKHGTRVRFHQGTAEVLGRVALIRPGAARRLGLDAESDALAPGSRSYVRLRFERTVVLVRGDTFIMRAYSPARTIAGGYVLDPTPPRMALRSESAFERCSRLDFDPVVDSSEAKLRAAAVMIDEAGESALPVSALMSRVGIEHRALASIIEALTRDSTAAHVGDVLVSRAVVEGLKAKILDALALHHRAQPLSDGLAREEARVRFFGHGHTAVFDYTLENLAGTGLVTGRDRLALSSHHVELSSEAARAREHIEQAFRQGGLTPPDPAAVASASGAPAPVATQVMHLLQRQKVLVKIDTLIFHDEALQRLKREVVKMKSEQAGQATISVPMFKERFGVTRRFAIPLLEYLDRERVTRRLGDVRLIL